MKTNASFTASAWGIKQSISSCEVGTNITYGGSNLQLSMYELHKRGPQLLIVFMATKFTLVLLSKIILKIRYSISCILYHITYTTIEELLYQTLYLPLKLIEVGFLLEGSITNMTCIIYLHTFFLGIVFKSFIDGKDYCTK